MSVVFDTYAWIEYFRGTYEGDKVADIVEKEGRIYTPSIVVAELRDKYVRNDMENEWILRKHFIKKESEVVQLDFATAERAGELKWVLREEFDEVGLADALILSHAISQGSEVVTGDSHLTFREEVRDISGSE